MKKTLTRAMSLLLVLVMLLGVVPMAAADNPTNPAGGSVTASAPTGLTAGGSAGEVTITSFFCNDPDGEGTEYESFNVKNLSAVKFSLSSNSDKIAVSGHSITPLKAGTADVLVNATYVGESWTTNATVTIKVTVGETEYTAEPVSLELLKGNSTTVSPTANVTPAYSGEVAWTLSGGSGVVTIDGMKITGADKGTATVTATPNVESLPNVTYNVTVTDEVTASLSAQKVEVKVGEQKTLPTISYSPALPSGVTPSVVWTSAATATASVVDNSKVEGVAVGTTTATAAITIDGYTVKSASDLTCDIDVAAADLSLTCENTSVAVGGSVTLEPILRFGTTAATNVQYTFTETSNTYATVTSAGRVSSNRAELVKVAVDVTSYTLNGTTVTASGANDIAPIEVLVRFYVTPDIDLTVAEGVTGFDLEDTKVFSKATVDGVTLSNPGNRSFADVFGTTVSDSSVQTSNYNTMHFSHIPASSAGYICDSKGDTLSSAYWSFLESVQFRQRAGRTGTTSFTVTMKDTNGLIVSNAKVTINVVGGEGDINYETDYKTAIKFDKTDFTKFWNNHEDDFKRDLAYVKFDVSTLIGSLYTDSTKKTEVKSSSYIAVADLSKLYYVPVSNKTTEYIDSMSFTAYDQYRGVSSGEYTIGNLTITLNATSNEISSRGLVLGTKYARNLADVYHTNTNKQLGYVVFDLPQAKYGKMYSSLPTVGGYTKVADGVALKATDKLYYDPSNSQLSLAKAAFIPAAGYNGEVELSYTAYDVNGGNLYAGVLRLDVVTKTASSVFTDITKTKYSWAADSADFLYYEGTAQGSNGKYNPKANITRQDFMLMLYRAFLADDYNTFVVSTNFPDVVKGTTDYSKEIYQAVGVAKYLGIAQGTNERFNPKSNITRQEAMVLIYRTLNTIDRDLEYTSGVKASSFKDYSKISSWATEAISNLVGHGVILGTNEKINPSSNITRAEMACILHRVITY